MENKTYEVILNSLAEIISEKTSKISYLEWENSKLKKLLDEANKKATPEEKAVDEK